MFASLLIANRGEIACRIIATARRMGLRTIAVYSQADAGALHVELADEARCIGPARAAESYLNIENILRAARDSGAEAIHPGYGFLSENADLAKACEKASIAFVGPPAAAIALMGRKDDAKAFMRKAGIPVVPGFDGRAQDAKRLAAEAKKIGYPVMLKAVAGGGGRGMRVVEKPAAFTAALESAKREAEAAFGDGALLIEKAVTDPRHIEVQIFCDAADNALHLFERECSLQRRHQKVIEEAPAPNFPESLRAKLTHSAIEAARAVGYRGAGTVEFLVEGGKAGAQTPFYFLEMNTRLQVEHPVTEAITGLDLVEWQLRVAAGEPLPLDQGAIAKTGHAIEARLYAEDPAQDFQPSSAKIHALEWPQGEGVRVDGGVRAGDTVSPHYDTLLAKIIAYGGNRKSALARLSAALEDTLVAGPKTNLAFLQRLLAIRAVKTGAYGTGLIAAQLNALTIRQPAAEALAAGVKALLTQEQREIECARQRYSEETRSPWSSADAFALAGKRHELRHVLIDGESQAVEIHWNGEEPDIRFADGAKAKAATDSKPPQVVAAGERVIVCHAGLQIEFAPYERAQTQLDVDAAEGLVKSPLPARVAKLYVAAGERIEKGEPIAVLEAMKMEHVLHAPLGGTVEMLGVSQGAQIEQDVIVAKIAGDGT